MASGLDTDSIISQLMAIEQNKVTAVQKRQVTVHAAQGRPDRRSRPSSTRSRPPPPTSTTARPGRRRRRRRPSDPTKVDVTLLGGAGIGGHTIQVDKLASSAQHGFTYTPSADRRLDRPLLRHRPARDRRSKVSIAVAANATATDVATAINANEGSPVYAAVVKDGADERLVFSARKTGENSNFTVDTAAMGAGELAGRGHRRTRAPGRRSTPPSSSTTRSRRARLSPTSSRTRSPACA